MWYGTAASAAAQGLRIPKEYILILSLIGEGVNIHSIVFPNKDEAIQAGNIWLAGNNTPTIASYSIVERSK